MKLKLPNPFKRSPAKNKEEQESDDDGEKTKPSKAPKGKKESKAPAKEKAGSAGKKPADSKPASKSGPKPGKADKAGRDESEKPDSAAQGSKGELYSLKEKFEAWWSGEDVRKVHARHLKEDAEGEEKSRAEKDGAKPAPAKAATAETSAPESPAGAIAGNKYDKSWPDERIAISERIWGQGFIAPGNGEYITMMVKPFALNPKMTFLDLSSGLGGGTRAVAEAFGLWAGAMEPCAQLVVRGMEELTKAGMSKKTPLTHYDPESLELKPKGFDCIFFRDITFTVVNKRQFFKTVRDALRPGGQLLFTDYFISVTGQDTTELRHWKASEPVTPDPWSVKQMREYLEFLKFDIRIEEDTSSAYHSLVLDGWREFLKTLHRGEFKKGDEKSDLLIKEFELWSRRLIILATGQLRVYRFHAILH